MRIIRTLRAALVVALAGMTLAGCYSLAQPSMRPGDARELLLAIARRGVDAQALVGASACSDTSLVDNAIRITASVASDPVERDVWIYQFRIRNWDESVAAVDACQAEFAAANPDAAITRLDIPVWRVFGADWSPELEQALRDAFTEAADLDRTSG